MKKWRWDVLVIASAALILVGAWAVPQTLTPITYDDSASLCAVFVNLRTNYMQVFYDPDYPCPEPGEPGTDSVSMKDGMIPFACETATVYYTKKYPAPAVELGPAGCIQPR